MASVGEGGADEQTLGIVTCHLPGGQEAAADGGADTHDDRQRDQPGLNGYGLDFRQKVEIGQGGAELVQLAQGGPDADGNTQAGPGDAQYRDLQQDGPQELSPGGAETAEETEFAAAARESDLRTAPDQDQGHEESDPTENNQIQAKGGQQSFGAALGIFGRLHRDSGAESLLQGLPDPRRILVRIDVDVDGADLSLLVKEALHLGQVHDREPAAGQRQVLRKVDAGADRQASRHRSQADVEILAHGPAHPGHEGFAECAPTHLAPGLRQA